jgi:hypothetical protein
MLKPTLILLVGLASTAGLAARPAAAAADSAQEVAASCRELLKPNPPKSFEAGLCFGSFTTLFALSGVVDQNHVPILGFCRAPDTKLIDFVRVFVRHVERHPQTAQVYYAIEAVNALVDAFPCKPK